MSRCSNGDDWMHHLLWDHYDPDRHNKEMNSCEEGSFPNWPVWGSRCTEANIFGEQDYTTVTVSAQAAPLPYGTKQE